MRSKVVRKYFYLLYWVYDYQIFEIRKNLWCKSFVPYFQQSEWILIIN